MISEAASTIWPGSNQAAPRSRKNGFANSLATRAGGTVPSASRVTTSCFSLARLGCAQRERIGVCSRLDRSAPQSDHYAQQQCSLRHKRAGAAGFPANAGLQPHGTNLECMNRGAARRQSAAQFLPREGSDEA